MTDRKRGKATDNPLNLYVLLNRATGKRFIGVSKSNLARVRHRYHTDARRFPYKPNSLLGDILKFGIGNVTMSLIETCNEASLEERRNFWINYFSTREPQGYNVAEEEKGDPEE